METEIGSIVRKLSECALGSPCYFLPHTDQKGMFVVANPYGLRKRILQQAEQDVTVNTNKHVYTPISTDKIIRGESSPFCVYDDEKERNKTTKKKEGRKQQLATPPLEDKGQLRNIKTQLVHHGFSNTFNVSSYDISRLFSHSALGLDSNYTWKELHASICKKKKESM